MEPIFDFGIRFDISDEDIHNFILGQKSKSTKYKDSSDLRNFENFCAKLGETRCIENIPGNELEKLLCHFYMKATTKHGKLYKPDTLTSIKNSLQHILNDRGSKIVTKNDARFIKSRQVLAARRKELTKLGKGNNPHAS